VCVCVCVCVFLIRDSNSQYEIPEDDATVNKTSKPIYTCVTENHSASDVNKIRQVKRKVIKFHDGTDGVRLRRSSFCIHRKARRTVQNVLVTLAF
jgi:hypothetical protein